MKYFILSILVFLISCSENEKQLLGQKEGSLSLSEEQIAKRKELTLSPFEYMKWVGDKENKLIASKTIDNIRFSLQYKPKDYVVCKELRQAQISQREYSAVQSQLGDMEYFDLRLSVEDFQGEFLKYNSGSSDEYQQRLNYCAFQMQNDIKIISDKDTIPCQLFHFERAFNIVPYGQFMLGFDKAITQRSELTFLFHDKVFNKGIVKFNFQSDCLKHLPKLSTI